MTLVAFGTLFLPPLVSGSLSSGKQTSLPHRVLGIMRGNYINEDPRTLPDTYSVLNEYGNNSSVLFGQYNQPTAEDL